MNIKMKIQAVKFFAVMIVAILLSSIVCGQALVSNPSNNQNYILTTVPRTAGIKNVNSIYTNAQNIFTVSQTIQYSDGLGRPVQSIQVMGSPTFKDVVQPIAYDQFGREAIKYEPYAVTGVSDGSFKANAINDQKAFYNSAVTPASVTKTAFPFAQTVFEQAPLNRITEQGAAGDNWQPAGTVGTTNPGHTNKIGYTSNNALAWTTDQDHSLVVPMYNVSITTTTTNGVTLISRSLTSNGNYSAGELIVTVSKDENWVSGRAGTTEEYRDINGRVVLKRIYNNLNNVLQELSTYYVYDNLGNLCFVLTPGSNADNALPTQTLLDNFCYQYQYDGRNRLIGKKVPSKGWEYTVYNQLDQTVATQDANQRAKNQWLIKKYDAMARVIGSFLWTNGNTAISQGQLQYNVKTQNSALWEARDYTNNTTVYPTGYVIGSYPNTGLVALSLNYYDDYNYGVLPTKYVYQQVSAQFAATASNMTEGLLVATRNVVLNTITASQPDMLWTINYYDDLGRVVQTYGQHYLGGTVNINNYDQLSTSYNFNNQISGTLRKHFNSASTTTAALTANLKYTFDQIGRKLNSSEQINGGSNIILSSVVYDEVGQVAAKKLHSENNGTTYLQTVSYSYNERGWLTQSSAPLFAMQLQYNAGSSPQYNGNITSQLWGTPGNLTKSYSYTYDKLNRLLSGVNNEGYSEQSITYDVMGNIQTLNRLAPGSAATNLTYTYASNNLQAISGLTTTNYGFDSNGNMNYDARNKNNISYNLADLPQTVTGNSNITYVYDVTGLKLRRISTNTGTTDYDGGIQYDNGAISFIQTEEGRALVSGGTVSYEYYLSDNLGNTRIGFVNSGGTASVVQQDDYYPFGKEIPRFANGIKNDYLFNAKELQEETGELDYSRRFYDPIIGRFTTVDPMSEKSRRFAVYAYCENNPIRNIDPDGMVTVKGGYGEDIDVSPFDTWSADGGVTVTYEGKSYNGLYSFFANNLDVAAAYNIQTGADLGISPFWSYMTKSDLVAFVKQIYPNLTPGSLQNTAGQIFEKTFNNFMTTYSDKGYSPNTTAFPTDVAGRKAVIPDGISAAKFEVKDEEDAVLDRTLIPYVSWYEVKATASVISGSSFGNQAIGLVDALYKSNPVAAQEGYSSLVFVTTSDATISPRFVNQAKTGYNINLWQFRAIYRKTDDGIKVSFYDPDFAGVFFRWNYIRQSVYLSH